MAKMRAYLSAAAFIFVVVLSGCGGGTGGKFGTMPAIPRPSISSLSPAEVMAGTKNLTLQINGADFRNDTTISLNETVTPGRFISSSLVTVAVPDVLLAQSGSVRVVVTNPYEGSSSPISYLRVINGPGMGFLNPSTVIAGHADFTLSITGGSDYTSAAVVRFNSSDRVTTFVSVGELRAQIHASDVAQPGSYPVTIYEPSLKASSGAAHFTVAAVPNTPNGAQSISLISVSNNGIQGDKGSGAPSISADGRFVVFDSDATNLGPEDTNGITDVFLRDTCAGATGCTPTTTRVSLGVDGKQLVGPTVLRSFGPVISANARVVAFEVDSMWSNPLTNQVEPRTDIYFRDTCIGALPDCVPSTTLVQSEDDTLPWGSQTSPSLTADGRYLGLSTTAINLLINDPAKLPQAYMYDTCVGAPAGCRHKAFRISVNNQGEELDGRSAQTSLSATGRYVAFASWAKSNIEGATGNLAVYLRDTCLAAPVNCVPSTKFISPTDITYPITGRAMAPKLSPNGRFVAFSIDYEQSGAPEGTTIVLFRDLCTGVMNCTPMYQLVSTTGNGYDMVNAWPQGVTDDAWVLFVGNVTSLPDVRDTYLRHMVAFSQPPTYRISVPCSGPSIQAGTDSAAISADGRTVVFSALSDELVPDDKNAAADVFYAPVTIPQQ